ncbi:hypothetical protein CCP3SC1_180033 [Gammaproteobacteria bacterium]
MFFRGDWLLIGSLVVHGVVVSQLKSTPRDFVNSTVEK